MIYTGIYKFENKINHNIYVGQSTNIEKRYSGHLYDAYFRPDDGTGVDPAILKYGIDNFDFTILELCEPQDLDEREIFWIAYFDSYHNGYNRTPGGKVLRGEDHPRALLTERDVWMIREMYANHISRRDVYASFADTGITPRGFKKVWDGENWPLIHMDVYTEENRLWHKKNTGHSEDQIGLSSLDRAIKQEEIDQWVLDHNNGLTINAIAKKYKRDNGVIEKYLHTPIAVNKVKYRGRKVKCENTNEIFTSINAAAKWAGCGATTLTRHLSSDRIAGMVPGTQEPARWIEVSDP